MNHPADLNIEPAADGRAVPGGLMAPLDRLLAQHRPSRWDPDERDDAWDLVTFADEAHQLGLVAAGWGRLRGFAAETHAGEPGVCLVLYPKGKAAGVAIEPTALHQLLCNPDRLTDEHDVARLLLERIQVIADGLAAIFDDPIDLGDAAV